MKIKIEFTLDELHYLIAGLKYLESELYILMNNPSITSSNPIVEYYKVKDLEDKIRRVIQECNKKTSS